MTPRDFPRKVAVFSNKFIFTTLTKQELQSHRRIPFCHPVTGKPCYMLTLDDKMHYTPFAKDHGPLNLAYIHRAMLEINDRLTCKSIKDPICLCTIPTARAKSNMALMAAIYWVMVEHKTPAEAFRPLAQMEFIPFRDAGNGDADFALSIQDCLFGVERAIQEGLIDMAQFDRHAYEYYERVDNGDMNLFGHFIPFASPQEDAWIATATAMAKNILGTPKCKALTYEHLEAMPKAVAIGRPFACVLKAFESCSVGLVVRLNEEIYDKRHFTERGIDHFDLYFDDGSTPTDEQVRTFITLAEHAIEQRGCKVAVHCKAGLGRTGVLIGAYLIYKHNFTALEAIAAMRIVRPGMVVGPQQSYMIKNQMKWARWAERDSIIRELELETRGYENPLPSPPLEQEFPHPSATHHASFPSTPLPSGSDLHREVSAKLSPRSAVVPDHHPKGGDADGQPRKAAAKSINLDAFLETGEVGIRIERPSPPFTTAARLHSPRDLADAAQASAVTAQPRGIKRTHTTTPRKQSPAALVPSSRVNLLVPELRRSGSTSSTSSVYTDSGRPYKRRPEDSSLPVTHMAPSSPPLSRESSPAADEMRSSAKDGPLLSLISGKLRRRSPATVRDDFPVVRSLRSVSPKAAEPASSRSFMPRLTPSKSKAAEPISPSRRMGITPPRFALFRSSPSPSVGVTH